MTVKTDGGVDEPGGCSAGMASPSSSSCNRNVGPAMGAVMRRRLEQAAGDSGDLMRRFTDENGAVPAAALLFDKGFRRTAVKPEHSATASFAALLRAAREADGVEVFNASRSMVCLTAASTKRAAEHDIPVSACTPSTSSTAVAAAESDAPGAGGSGGGQIPRNVKGELQALLCKLLGRPVNKNDMVFTTERVRDQPPAFEATLVAFGRTFRGTACPQKKSAEHSASLIALEALLSGQHTGDPESETHSRGSDSSDAETFDGSQQTSCWEEPNIDYKGQLLAWLQARGLASTPGVVRFTVSRADGDAKIFKCHLLIKSLGGREFEGTPQPRANFPSSAHARQAAQQSVARRALESLEAEKQQTACAAPSRRVQSVQALRIPVDAYTLPSKETLDVVDDDFLGTAEKALCSSDVFPHPLQWSGNRPKGLCLYERVHSSCDALTEAETVNTRASYLLRGASACGNVLLLDASAHSKGATLADVTGQRYEALKAERRGSLSCPAVALNVHRSMVVAGDPELPLAYDPEHWVGIDPRTLLQEVLRRRGSTAAPQFEIVAGPEGAHCACVRWTVGAATPGSATGAHRRTKAESQQDAALAALHILSDVPATAEAGGQCAASELARLPWSFYSAAQAVVADSGAENPEQNHDVPASTLLSLQYSIALARNGDKDGFEVESRSRFRCATGAGVLHPALERIAMICPLGESCEYWADCEYEGVPTRARLNFLIFERVPPQPGIELGDASSTSPLQQRGVNTLIFDPPLWRQRLDFISKVVAESGAKKVADLGCGDGRLLEALLMNCGLDLAVGVDSSEQRAKAATRRLERACGARQSSNIMVADFLVPDQRWCNLDAVILSEVIEHVPESQLSQVASAVFGPAPRLAIVTTPNAEFGKSLDGDTADRCFRHPDHEREWTRAEFRQWAEAAAASHGYSLADPCGVGNLPGQEANGPCTQIAVFYQSTCGTAETSTTHPTEGSVVGQLLDEGTEELLGMAKQIDFSTVVARALHDVELVDGTGLRKFVMREGVGQLPAPSSRVTVHHATYLASGKRISTSRDGRRVEPCAFQLGGCKVLEAWQRAVATMREGEVAWVQSPPSYAFGEFGCAPHIPAGATMWFALELVHFKLPGTVRAYKDVASALEEGERHLETGRADIKRGAFGQGRQALRRAVDAVPEKLLLRQPSEAIQRYVRLERACLLNQALCAQRLGEAAEDSRTASAHWEEVVRVCTKLLDRHAAPTDPSVQEDRAAVSGDAGTNSSPGSLAELGGALRDASIAAASGDFSWAAKAFFRRGLARERLNEITDAVSDLEAAQRLLPSDVETSKSLEALRRRRMKVEMKPDKMFVSILEREREERDREEAAKTLQEKKRRREERLRKRGADNS